MKSPYHTTSKGISCDESLVNSSMHFSDNRPYNQMAPLKTEKDILCIKWSRRWIPAENDECFSRYWSHGCFMPNKSDSDVWHTCWLYTKRNYLLWAALYLSWGTWPPPSWTTVGKTSIRLVGSWIRRPAGSTPGHRSIPGTRIPPSQPPMPLPPVFKHEQERMWLKIQSGCLPGWFNLSIFF